MPGETAFERQLVRDGVVDESRLVRAREHAQRAGVDLSQSLVATGVATADAVYKSLAEFCEMRYVAPSRMDIPADLVAKVPARFATHYNFVPIQERNGTIVVAVSDPLNHQLLDDIRLIFKKQRVEVCVATPEEIARTSKAIYGVGAETVERILSESDTSASVVTLDGGAGGTDLGDDSIDASIIKFVNELLAEAIRSGEIGRAHV